MPHFFQAEEKSNERRLTTLSCGVHVYPNEDRLHLTLLSIPKPLMLQPQDKNAQNKKPSVPTSHAPQFCYYELYLANWPSLGLFVMLQNCQKVRLWTKHALTVGEIYFVSDKRQKKLLFNLRRWGLDTLCPVLCSAVNFASPLLLISEKIFVTVTDRTSKEWRKCSLKLKWLLMYTRYKKLICPLNKIKYNKIK